MSATFIAAGSTQNSGCAPSVSIRLARRIAWGPSRAPARLVVPISSGTPATTNSAPGSLRVMPRKPGAVAKVGTSVIVYGRTRAMTISARIRTMIRNSISSVRLAELSSYSAEYVSRMIASLRSTAAFTAGTRNSSSADA